MLAAALHTDMEALQQDLLQAIVKTNVEPNPPTANIAPELNAVLNNNTTQQPMILDLLRQLNENVQNMNGQGQPDQTTRCNRKVFYCWSHGMCGHNSSGCHNRRKGIRQRQQKVT